MDRHVAPAPGQIGSVEAAWVGAGVSWGQMSRRARGSRSHLAELSVGLPLVWTLACGGGGDGCVEVDVQGCTPAFDPTFDQVWAEVLEPSCTAPGTSCHGESRAAGAGNGLILVELDSAYNALVNGGFVIPGDAGCSALVDRLETSDTSRRMPLGEVQLSEPLRCGVRQWIEAGAPR